MKELTFHKSVKNKSPLSKKSVKNMKNKRYLKRVKTKKKGGYPRGTKKGDGGLAITYTGMGFTGSSDGGGMGETKMPSFKEFLNMLEEAEEVELDLGDDLSTNDTDAADEDIDVDDIDNEDIGEVEDSDPNREGLIRRVQGAHLVYKRQTEEGTYEELWIYRIDKQFDDEIHKKQAILAGTDIDLETGESEDGMQKYEIWTAGDAQMVSVTGLPN